MATKQNTAAPYAFETEVCRVAPLAIECAKVIEAYDKAQEASSDCPEDEKLILERDEEALRVRRRWLEESASHHFAKSGVGALYQLHLVSDCIVDLEARIKCGTEDKREAKQIHLNACRLLYSLQAFIQALTGAKAEEACGEYYMPRHLNRLAPEIVGETSAEA